MADEAQPALLDHLVKRYRNLKLRLTRVLRNGDLASDALQDTWLRVQSQQDHGPIGSPTAYLMRMAVNIAIDIQRKQGPRLPTDDVDALLELSDPAPGPAQTAEARSELEALLRIMRGLPQRRREILILVRWEGMPQQEVAELLGVSLRVVEHELKRAHDYCEARMRNAEN
ncbi:RNA polymerase sigma factor [Variovorax sp. LT1R16]|uniref:RNA polymerase sigma factor n=1 Tax=Variovorax sp. LT1R16 TaxID=3443728 RepID=UPI003F45AC95